MVDFTPPFAQDGERRLPTATEQQLGFSCDPARLRELFNGLFWLLQGQVKSLADEAGVSSNQVGDLTVLKRAVLALIDAATGGNPDGYILMTQARSRLPVFPDILHDDGHLGVLSPSTGNVRVPAGRDFLHRGIFLVTTSQEDYPTDPSKTYHLRWNPTDGFVLRDLASGTYNPSTLAEGNPAFDSKYDDMLVARVVTNSSNVVTVTNLRNRNRLEVVDFASPTPTIVSTAIPANTNGAEVDHTFTLNWARTPKAIVAGSVGQGSSSSIRILNYANWDDAAQASRTTRYAVRKVLTTAFDSSLVGQSLYSNLHLLAIA